MAEALEIPDYLAVTGTVYDYNRHGIVAFRLPELAPSMQDYIKAWLKELADGRVTVRIEVTVMHTEEGDS